MTPSIAASQSPPRWHLLYYALAAFDVLIVLASLYLSLQIMNIYSRSVEVNQEWAQRLEAYADLGRLAQAVNAPGNDVFDTQDTPTESAKMRAAQAAFHTRMADLRREVDQHLTPSVATTITRHFDAVQTAMTAMMREEELIFSYFSQRRARSRATHGNDGSQVRRGQRCAGSPARPCRNYSNRQCA